MDDAIIRQAAFSWLGRQTDQVGPVLSRDLLERGFEYEGIRIRLVGPQGIFKPQVMQLPLSITTVANSPYADAFGQSVLRYKYRGADPQHRDNVGLRQLMRLRIPLIYFHAVMPAKYAAFWPVFVVQDDPADLTFSVAVDDAEQVSTLGSTLEDESGVDIRRRYVTTIAQRRIHQMAFRERVIEAYRRQCAFCRLRHTELLDAAHIIGDKEPEGEPVVRNGIALCKLHHAAFDRFFLSVRPDYVVEIRRDVLDEVDGPMLKHGLQGMHGMRIQVPRASHLQPDPGLLESRHERFLALTR